MNWITHDGWKFAAWGGDGIDRVLATGNAEHLEAEALRYVSEFGGGDALSIAPDVALVAIARVAG